MKKESDKHLADRLEDLREHLKHERIIVETYLAKKLKTMEQISLVRIEQLKRERDQ
jgi:hypothetical protein